MAEKHPHTERPSAEQLASLLQAKSPVLREIYQSAHQLVLEALPDVDYSVDTKDGVTGYGARQYGYGGWGMAALGAYAKWVSLVFMRGTDLPDPHGLLEGTGKNLRHIKLRSPEEFAERREALSQMIQAAAQVNQRGS